MAKKSRDPHMVALINEIFSNRTRAQRAIIYSFMENARGIPGFYERKFALEVPGMTELAEAYLLNTTTTEGAVSDAMRCRAAAKKVAKLLKKPQLASAAEAGFDLGLAWSGFFLEISGMADSMKKHMASVGGTRDALANRREVEADKLSLRNAEINDYMLKRIREGDVPLYIVGGASSKWKLKHSYLEKHFYRPMRKQYDAEQAAKLAAAKRKGSAGN